MKRAEALALWRRIAAGDLRREQDDPVDLLEWIETIAADVVQADDEPDPKRRPYVLTKALGLADRMEPYPELRQALEIWDSFGPSPEWARGGRSQAMVGVARSIYPSWKPLTDEEVLRRAKRSIGEA